MLNYSEFGAKLRISESLRNLHPSLRNPHNVLFSQDFQSCEAGRDRGGPRCSDCGHHRPQPVAHHCQPVLRLVVQAAPAKQEAARQAQGHRRFHRECLLPLLVQNQDQQQLGRRSEEHPVRAALPARAEQDSPADGGDDGPDLGLVRPL